MRIIVENLARPYLGNLTNEAERETLLRIFRIYGQVTDVEVPVDRNAGHGMGVAFVEMPCAAEATAAVRALAGHRLRGHALCVRAFQSADGKRPRARRPS